MRTNAKENSGRKRRILAAAIVTAILVGGAGGAYAYWTNTGSGTGSAATGTNVPVTINQTTVVTPLAPGVAAQTLSGTFTNTNSGPVYVGTVTVSIGTITGGGPTCEATDYVITNGTMTVNAQVPVGTGGSWTGASIAFNNKVGENQNDCKNATVALVYSSN
jgi:hypothetical protein